MLHLRVRGRGLSSLCVSFTVFALLFNACMWRWWTAGNRGDGNNNVSSPSISNDFLQIVMRVPPPSFAPRNVGLQLLLEYKAEELERRRQQEEANDSPITEEELLRARRNIVTMLLPSENNTSVGVTCASCSQFVLPPPANGYSECIRLLGDWLVLHLANLVVSETHDAAPVIVDYGCLIGASLARRHTRSTVLCVFDPHDDNFGSQEVLPNLIRIVASGGFLNGFAPFFSSCNFISVSTVFFPLVPTRSSLQNHHAERMLMQLVAHIVRGSGVVLAVLPVDNCDMLHKRWLDSALRSLSTPDAVPQLEALRRRTTVRCRVLADFERHRHERMHSGWRETSLRLFQLTVTYSARLCQKTWNAPLLQWERVVLCVYNRSRVRYRVIDLSSRSVGRRTSARVIHPLQYVPSLNVATLLAAGLSVYERLRLLSGMIATARYSDPLPHNWMVGNEKINAVGGRVFRIDKVDKRFDAAVAEEQNYWAHSVRGYLHLLAHHLCFPVESDGVVSVLYALDVESRHACRRCIETCAYFPKGAEPCTPCMLCAAGVARYADGNESLEGHPRNVETVSLQKKGLMAAKSCREEYASYRAAMMVWETWRRRDMRSAIRL